MARAFSASGHILIGNPAILQISGTDLTLSAWVKTTSLTTFQVAIGKRASGLATISYELGLSTSGKPFMQIGSGTGSDITTGQTTVPTTRFAHILGIKQGGSLRIYLDGTQDASTASGNNVGGAGANVRLGSDDSGFPLLGDGCEFAIWEKTLSDAEVVALSRGIPAPLIRRDFLRGYWPVWGTALPSIDLSGNGNNGSQVGASLPLANHAPISRMAA